ncbi:restriction endonuclease subunit S [Halomonas sp. 11-S5]|uniref:restriction endonuclease subunit S n=1 Tax=Halomonas sp. 11-S5 TaxID=2994064 RepID=UPI002469420B|nr:restriction endonuclease subunit S [Halomonas sp. 11-S5]
MSFPKYPEHKDSGVEWLGEVPAHWEKLKLSRISREKCDGPFGSAIKSEHYRDSGVRVIRLQNIKKNSFNGRDAAYIDADYYYREISRSDVVGGDLLVAGLGDDNNVVGRACVAPCGVAPAMVKADCFRFRLDNTRVLPDFLAYQLSAGAEADAGLLSTGSTRSRIPLSAMGTRVVALPPHDEQVGVSAFLDHETARIDALVEQQQRLIELLKEKRQAVISHAVTKGMDPNVPMKDSGVEWLGEVPAHWEVFRLKQIVTVQGGATPAKERLDFWNGKIPWVSPKDMKKERVSDSSDHITEKALSETGLSMINSGAVLIVVRGMILAHSVPVAIAEAPLTINQDMKAVTPSEKMSSEYMLLLLSGIKGAIFNYIDSSAHGTKKLEWERFENIMLPLPKLTEQRSICRKIHEQVEPEGSPRNI